MSHFANTVAVPSLDWLKRKICVVFCHILNINITLCTSFHRHFEINYTLYWLSTWSVWQNLGVKLFPLKSPLTKGRPSPSSSKGSRLGTKQTPRGGGSVGAPKQTPWCGCGKPSSPSRTKASCGWNINISHGSVSRHMFSTLHTIIWSSDMHLELHSGWYMGQHAKKYKISKFQSVYSQQYNC